MPKPYHQLRAQMSPDAQRQAEDKAQALLATEGGGRFAQMTRLRQEVSAMASALEAAQAMPGGGTLQATVDTALCALIAVSLGIEDWLARQEDPAPVQGQDLPVGAVPIVRWPIQCPFCRCTAPLTAYDLQEGGIYTCSGCHTLLRAASWRAAPRDGGHLRWTIPLQEVPHFAPDAPG